MLADVVALVLDEPPAVDVLEVVPVWLVAAVDAGTGVEPLASLLPPLVKLFVPDVDPEAVLSTIM